MVFNLNIIILIFLILVIIVGLVLILPDNIGVTSKERKLYDEKHADTIEKSETELYHTKVMQSSYISDMNDTIYLRSHDFNTNSGTEWRVFNDKISIRSNSNDFIKTVLFKDIYYIKLEHNKIIYSMLIKNRFIARGVYKDEIRDQKPLIFHYKDQHIAQAVHDRILQK